MSTTIIEEAPILSVECKEPKQTVTRNVYKMLFTPENIKTFWEKSSQHRTLFADEIDGNFKRFLEMFATMDDDGNIHGRGIAYVVDDFTGVFYMTNINRTEALVHFTFFDGRLKGREELTKEMLKYAFNHFGFLRLNAEVALFAKEFTFNFVERVGFIKEGRKRKAIMYKGELFDVALYGLLREEII